MDEPVVVLESMAAGLFDEEEMVFVLGRELGHVMAGHAKYQAVAETVCGAAAAISSATIGIGKLAVDAVLGLKLYRWCRYAEHTADRAGYLACQNHEAVLRVLLKLSGYPARRFGELHTRALVKQAAAFRARVNQSMLDQAFSFLSNVTHRQPFTISRTAELLDWVAVGGYEKVLSKLGRSRVA